MIDHENPAAKIREAAAALLSKQSHTDLASKSENAAALKIGDSARIVGKLTKREMR